MKEVLLCDGSHLEGSRVVVEFRSIDSEYVFSLKVSIPLEDPELAYYYQPGKCYEMDLPKRERQAP